MKHLIIGTAGHVDHGKSALIRALTGIDTDRLQEEKKRGISIDLGFAPFSLPGGRLAGVVDVPGHERFIHNMLAGAGGMDLVLLVVDATEGVMPQTREHLQILELLHIPRGIVVINKIDLVEEEWRELVEEEVREKFAGTFLEKAPLCAVSAITGEGIEDLKQLIDRITAEIPPRDTRVPFRMPLDRSFSSPGFGTIVTGTLIQGLVRAGDIVEIVPPMTAARVRSIQVHGRNCEEASAGQRVALNLSGLEKEQALRGAVVCAPGYYRPTTLVDASIRLLNDASRPIKNLDPVHFYLGTARLVARLLLLDRDELLPGEAGFVQCRLERPLAAERRDRFIIRSYSPVTTIGGGIVLDPFPERHRRFKTSVLNRLAVQEQGLEGDHSFVLSQIDKLNIADFGRLEKATRLPVSVLESIIKAMELTEQVIMVGESVIGADTYRRWTERINSELERFHEAYPLLPGISRARLKTVLPASISTKEYEDFLEALANRNELWVQGDLVKKFSFVPRISPADRDKLEQITGIYRQAGWTPPALKETLTACGVDPLRRDEYETHLLYSGELVKISEEFYFHRDIYREAVDILNRHFKNSPTLTLAQFRDLTGSSRKIVQPLLEYFDRKKITKRVGDHRVAID